MFLRSMIHLVLMLALLLAGLQTGAAQSSSFTYQGQLEDGGNQASGNYDLQFRLFDALASGSQVGSTQVLENVAVASGIFTVALDFGAASFPGENRFLEIAVRPGASVGAFTTLNPLQQIASTPYALQSLNATTAQNALQLGEMAASQYVLTNDARLSDARAPTANSTNYIQNTASPQASSNFNISGSGVVGGSFTAGGAVTGSGVTGLVAGGGAIGVQGTSPDGIGVRGNSTNSAGVLGATVSGSIGVWGVTSGATGTTYGVAGTSSSSSGTGVRGEAPNATGTTYGVAGNSSSTSGTGVRGEAYGDTGSTFGVDGESTSTSGSGVRGQATSGSGTTYGVYGKSFSSSGVGVFGTGTTGVRGETPSTTGFGVAGVNNGGGSSISWGIYGQNISSGGYAIEGYNPNGIGVRGNGGIYAGQFIGNVQIQGTLTKTAGTFQIDHPLDPANKYLIHSFVESPDMKNLYDGIATLDEKGEAWVELPVYFEALNRDFRYQLTALGSSAPNLFVAEQIADNRFRIAGGAPQQQISWQITGTRKDAYAEAHPIEVEVDKSAAERGKYLYPGLYGQPESKAIIAPTRPPVETTQTRPVSTATRIRP